MKHQVFLFSFFCVFSSCAMEKRSNFLKERCSEKETLFLINSMMRFALRASNCGLIINEKRLAKSIYAVQESSMTKREHYQAISKIWSRDMALIDEAREAIREQENWRIDERSKERRKIY